MVCVTEGTEGAVSYTSQSNYICLVSSFTTCSPGYSTFACPFCLVVS